MSATYERVPAAGYTMTWGVPYHAVVGDCVDALEWRVPWPQVQAIALSYGLAVVCNVPMQSLVADADQHIWAFIVQKTLA